MTGYSVTDRNQNSISETRRERTLRAAFTELALSVSLVVSIVVIIAVTGASGALASTRSDLIMMEESAGSALTTMAIITVIFLVMGVLTILALRDVAPDRSKRGHRRTTTTTTTTASRR